MSKRATLLLITVLAVSSLIVVSSAFAQAIPKPSVPEFNVKLIDSSYVIPETTTIDPYTGQTVTHPSQHVEARTIEIRIKNVPFTPFEIENGSNTYTAQFYYNIRFKGHFEQEWHEAYNPNTNGLPGRDSELETVISLQGEYSSTEGLKLTPASAGFYATFPPNAQVDFQVEAMIGYIHHVVAIPFSADVFEGETSGWSATQTITISESQTLTPSPASTPTPTSPIFKPTPSPTPEPLLTPEQLRIIVGVTIAAALIGAGLGLLFYFKKRRREAEPS
jgi:hypothetical protein